jgi:hypothetical protein
MSTMLGDYLTAAETDQSLHANGTWLANMRDLGQAMLKFPDTILGATPPPDAAILFALYEQWAPHYRQLAECVLAIVASAETNDLVGFSRAKTRFGELAAVVAALAEARNVCVVHITRDPGLTNRSSQPLPGE